MQEESHYLMCMPDYTADMVLKWYIIHPSVYKSVTVVHDKETVVYGA